MEFSVLNCMTRDVNSEISLVASTLIMPVILAVVSLVVKKRNVLQNPIVFEM